VRFGPVPGLVVALCVLAPVPARAAAPDYGRDILPLLKTRCYQCHDGRKQKAGYRMDIRARALRGGESGKPAIVAGKLEQSDMIRRIVSTDDDVVMPPSGKRLTEAEVKLLRAWIAAGAPWPDALANEDLAKAPHWAFRAPQRPALPAVKNTTWERNPIDRFILARLEKEGLKPAPEADRGTLIRRLSLDLIGLPPTVAEVDAFIKDTRPDAHAKLVDRLLASPHYGERWARMTNDERMTNDQ
jgi:mono/diheme cytochrome c family protein